MADRPDRHPWLDLLEVDGPFLSRPALDDVYDDAWPPKISNEHRDILDSPAVLPAEWDETAMEQVDRVLTEVLGYREGRTLGFNPGTVIHPIYDNAAISPHAAVFSRGDPDKPRLVVLAGPAAAETPDSLDPETITTHYGWPSTAVQRAALAARGFGADLALVTNGWQHLIVWVGSGITGWAWIDPSRYRLDRRLADAFVALLSAPSVTTDADTSTADLLRLSQDKQVDVTERLGIQVRQAAEALVNAVSRANRNTDSKLLDGVAPNKVYAGVVTVLMRTVFLLNAEERDLISSGDPWDRSYSVSALLDQLDDDHYRHQGIMSRRHGAWLRLLAAARAVYGGVRHSKMNVPAYGGNLFDPTRYPFLEGVGVDGEVFDVGVIDDATTRHVLGLLQRLGGQRLSYRAFSVEQIGQVYESLLDHSAVSVREDTVVLGLVGTKGGEPEVELADLEDRHAKGKLADWLAENHDPASGKGKVERWQVRIDRAPDERVAATLSQACHGKAELLARVEPFAGLLRSDSREIALVFLPGDVYVTETANRRDTGTAYTSPEFAAEIAHYALEHLVYEPGPHNEENESSWQIKQPGEILELRVCDPAVGSGAILVAAVRYLANKLVESRLEHGELTTRDLETAAADPMTTDPHVQARRDVVSQCFYAVDRDPMAVEMAKLSLWLVTMADGRPFTFLDHAIKCGDSLLGITEPEQVTRLNLSGSADSASQLSMRVDPGSESFTSASEFFGSIDAQLLRAATLRQQLLDDPVDSSDIEMKEKFHDEATRITRRLSVICDALVAANLSTANSSPKARADRIAALAAGIGDVGGEHDLRSLTAAAEEWAEGGRPPEAEPRRFFHWLIEFPEILHGGGQFDAIVGNPPFQGGQLISDKQGKDYREYLVEFVAGGTKGSCDLVGYFFRRVAPMAKSIGLIATNSISQGQTHDVGLRPLFALDGMSVSRAWSNRVWPHSKPVVHVAMIWMDRGDRRSSYLDGQVVPRVSSDLYPINRAEGMPLPLPPYAGRANQGFIPVGKGFLLEPSVAASMIAADGRNAEVVRPFMGGELNSDPEQRPSRWTIFFSDMSLEEAERFELPIEHVREFVKPERATNNQKSTRERWWKYGACRPQLAGRLAGLSHAIALVGHSEYVIPVRVDARTIFSNGLVVFPFDDWGIYGAISSTIHRVWADRYGSTIKSDLRYTHTTIFDTFPFPRFLDSVSVGMQRLDDFRAEIFRERQIGVTKLYSMYHDPSCSDSDIANLRLLHNQLDAELVNAFGWGDIDVALASIDTRYGTFLTVPNGVRYELLDRLLELNFQQAAEQTGRSLESVIREAQQHV